MELQLISKEQNLKLHLISDIFICTFACLTGGIVNVPLCALFYILMSYFSVLLASSSANGDRTKEKQCSGNSFVVDFD